ncbi:MAG: bifunctional diaminohydroxyphosphoribosylaminopyrimidine deaminase/5-amino-6-(5-phosphoribosylamino)uracil reductase RibD [Deltaproteobacteria bacterium]|nr:bifunctional diaminohydroxyphosphoribosylaminopyrimidine deaminase/5-amino-6-(5-phosphoribosylamino)uracil reductase RibD [Deltaproteobacteria bacterium]
MVDRDEVFMRQALQLAQGVVGRTGDNPAVGCVIVREGVVIGAGATQESGKSHAEVMAVHAAEAAGHTLSGAEVFVTLEPCSFTGRTPPCTQLLVLKAPARVVVGLRDPHPKVRGSGIAELRAAGIVVRESVLTGEVRELLADWLSRFPEAS